MDNKQKAQQLCDVLNKANIRPARMWSTEKEPTTWEPNNSNIKSLLNLPDTNFHKLLTMNYAWLACYSQVYEEWGKQGFLRFEPYINPDNDNTTLTIRHDRHLHMFRGYHFQVSGTPDGIVSHETGCYRTDFLLKHTYHDDELWSQSYLANMLCYAAMIDTAYVYENFQKWFDNNPDKVDEYIKYSMHYWRMDITHGWKEFQKYISYKDHWSVPGRKLYRLKIDNKVICEFAFGMGTIQVKTSLIDGPKNILTILVPDPIEGIHNVQYIDQDLLDEFTEAVRTPRSSYGSHDRQDIKMLLLMALALLGIKLNWITFYTIKDLKSINPTNVPGQTIETLNDICEVAADEH